MTLEEVMKMPFKDPWKAPMTVMEVKEDTTELSAVIGFLMSYLKDLKKAMVANRPHIMPEIWLKLNRYIDKILDDEEKTFYRATTSEQRAEIKSKREQMKECVDYEMTMLYYQARNEFLNREGVEEDEVECCVRARILYMVLQVIEEMGKDLGLASLARPMWELKYVLSLLVGEAEDIGKHQAICKTILTNSLRKFLNFENIEIVEKAI